MRTLVDFEHAVINKIVVSQFVLDKETIQINIDTQDEIGGFAMFMTPEQAYQLCQCLREKVDAEQRNNQSREVAKILGTSPRVIRRGMMKGDLPFGVVVYGQRNRYIIPKIQFEKWLFGTIERRDEDG